jgi:Cdc6-like AAA superfamily ATPase
MSNVGVSVGSPLLWTWQVLIVAERTVGGLVHPEKIEEMDSELTKVIEDFDRAVDVEALCLTKRTGKHSCCRRAIVDSQIAHVEQEILLGRLKYVEAGHDLGQRCMEGTRQSILDRTMAWVADAQERNDAPRRNTYWFYGSPGIGKTSLAHSICAKLHDRGQLAGAFFCRRDDPNLSDPTNILPTLIYKLAGIFPAFRAIVANRLRNDLSLTPKSMKYTLFLDFIRKVSRHPKHTLVFVIDALDECGDDQSRSDLLKVLIGAAKQASWLKIIVTSRPEVDIQRFFDAPIRYDLGTDQEAKIDLQTFTRSQFDLIASKWHLSASWPEESLLSRVVSQANGLFIFIKTFVLALKKYDDPKESLEAILKGAAGTGMEGLYRLYSNILKSRPVHSNIAGFRRMIGVLLTTAPNRSLCEETIATLAGVPAYLVKKWVDDLSSLLYRDEGANGEIRVRHLSISEFFVSDHCDYQVTLEDAHVKLGITCLETMVKQLRFNICKLEDSRLTNAQVKNLPTLIKQNISDALQYSSFYWSNHICSTPNNRDQRVLEGLEFFFEGVHPLFWIEVLSIMGMVPIGAPSLRRVISWVKVSTTPPCCSFAFEGDSDLL